MNHRDLDMSDVLADARDMEQDYLNRLFFELDKKSDAELGHDLYKVGDLARQGNYYAIDVTRTIEVILIHRHSTLCEGCLGRHGCDMCCPPQFDDRDYSAWYGGERGYNDGLRWSDFI
jgi:hypothetical protein